MSDEAGDWATAIIVGLLLIYVVAILAAYLIGSIPFGLLLTRAAGLGDIRAIGSGNIGATNVLRTGRKGLAAATLLLDGGKGAAVVIAVASTLLLEPIPDRVPSFSYFFGEITTLSAGFIAVIGHDFSIWLRFKGGKGVATTLGVLLGVNVFVGLAACATWLAVAALSRYSSLAALAAMAMAPVFAWFIAGPHVAILALALAALGFWRHSANIRRLLKGEEPRIGRGGAKKP